MLADRVRQRTRVSLLAVAPLSRFPHHLPRHLVTVISLRSPHRKHITEIEIVPLQRLSVMDLVIVSSRHGVEKIVPDKKELAEAFRRFKRGKRIKKIVESELKVKDETEQVPDNLEDAVADALAKERELRWIDAVQRIVATDTDDGGNEHGGAS